MVVKKDLMRKPKPRVLDLLGGKQKEAKAKKGNTKRPRGWKKKGSYRGQFQGSTVKVVTNGERTHGTRGIHAKKRGEGILPSRSSQKNHAKKSRTQERGGDSVGAKR